MKVGILLVIATKNEANHQRLRQNRSSIKFSILAKALVVRLIFLSDPQLKSQLHDILKLFQDTY